MRKAVLSRKDLLAALDSIQTFTVGFDVAAFQEDDKTLSAVIRNLHVMGEAVAKPGCYFQGLDLPASKAHKINPIALISRPRSGYNLQLLLGEPGK